MQNRKHGGGQEVDVVKLFILEGRCFIVLFFLIDREYRARESETRAEAVTVIKGSVGEKDKS